LTLLILLRALSRRPHSYCLFNEMMLTIYIMDEKVSLEQVVELEQYFIDTLKPNLNVDLIASSSGYLLFINIV